MWFRCRARLWMSPAQVWCGCLARRVLAALIIVTLMDGDSYGEVPNMAFTSHGKTKTQIIRKTHTHTHTHYIAYL